MTQLHDGLDGFIRHEPPPTTPEEQRAVARRSRGEWQESKRQLAKMRAYDESQRLASLPLALNSATESAAYWAGILADQFDVVPPRWKPTHRLTVPEFGAFVTAGWNYEYWRKVTVRITTAVADAVNSGEDGYSAGWQTVCNICENQAEELDGGLVRLAASVGIGTSLPTANLAGYAAAGLSLRTNRRLGNAVAEGARTYDEPLGDAFIDALQPAVFLSAANPRTDRSFLNQVAAEVEALGRPMKTHSLEENLESFRASEAAAAQFAAAEDRMLLDQLEGQAGLAPGEREVSALLRQGLPQTEIAERLGLASGTVKSTASRARKKLRAAAS